PFRLFTPLKFETEFPRKRFSNHRLVTREDQGSTIARMVSSPELLVSLGVAFGLALLLSVRKSWGRTARRIVGTSILVFLFAAITIWAIAACILFLSLYE